VLIPLGDASTLSIRTFLESDVPEWQHFKVQDWAEYLGFMLGPGGYPKQWNSAIRKACDTCRRWASLQAAFFFNILACNIYILPLFSFIGQLAAHNSELDEFMKTLRTTLFTGPGNWIPKYLLCAFAVFGFPVQLRDLGNSILACQIRIAHSLKETLDDTFLELGLCIQNFKNNNSERTSPLSVAPARLRL
jgi:hypothetical protein